jgi:hypothetical protein
MRAMISAVPGTLPAAKPSVRSTGGAAWKRAASRRSAAVARPARSRSGENPSSKLDGLPVRVAEDALAQPLREPESLAQRPLRNAAVHN